MMIKTVGPENINYVIAMGELWAEEFEIEDFDPEQWREIVRAYSIYVDHRCVCFYNDLNKPVGMLLGSIVRIPHSGRMVGQIHYIWLLPEHWSHDTLYQLHSDFETWVRGFLAQEITAPDFYSMPEQYRIFFEDMGYELCRSVQSKGLE